MTDDLDNEAEPTDTTGSSCPASKLINVPFGCYTVTLRLTPTDRFVEIVAISVAKDFRSLKQTIESTGVHDVGDIYEEEKE